MAFEVAKKIPRSLTGFTQGLEFHDGKLFESTGRLAGGTRINSISTDGLVTRIRDFGQSFFGEGLTIFNNQIYQLSWTEHQVGVFDLAGKQIRRMYNARDGWGLTHDANSLIFSDGSNKIFFVDPNTFAVTRSLPVMLGNKPLSDINELEYVDGKIYANIFMTDWIMRIDAQNGCVDSWADLGNLRNLMDDAERDHIATDLNFVLNGIAYDRASGLFYVTGKSWHSIFTGRFVEH